MHPMALQVNHIYEKLIQINRGMKKITNLLKMYDLDIELPRYEVDLELNKKVEMAMLGRKQERMEYDRLRAKSGKMEVMEERRKGENNCYLEDVELPVRRNNEEFMLLDEEEVY